MGIEGQHHRSSALCCRSLHDGLQQSQMAAMLPIEVTDGQHGMRRLSVLSKAPSNFHASRFMGHARESLRSRAASFAK